MCLHLREHHLRVIEIHPRRSGLARAQPGIPLPAPRGDLLPAHPSALRPSARGRHLCVGHCIDCRPEILPVYLVKLDDVTNPCNPCSSIPNNPTFYWNNARGTIVIFEEVCESNYENALLLGFMDNVIEWDSGEYLPPGALKACGKPTALEVVEDSKRLLRSAAPRRKCVFYATKMSSVLGGRVVLQSFM